MAQPTGPLSGFRDILPAQMRQRESVLAAIAAVYRRYGFVPLETPAIERIETLTGKYGDEGEKLMYRFETPGGDKVALRYDLTVPLCRVMATYGNRIPIPFRRYQIGPVWRGESPQSGRYREFVQFDADIVGTASPVADAEVIAMMADSMKAIGASAIVRVNDRRLLDALARSAGVLKDATRLIGLIDKAEKIGQEKFEASMVGMFGIATVERVNAYLAVTGGPEERLAKLETLLGEPAAEAVANLRRIFAMLGRAGYGGEQVILDQSIARGLDYYTGTIYETQLKDMPSIGSVASGGRYDKLIGLLGGPDLPAVGTSVGVDRLMAALDELGAADEDAGPVKAMIANFTADDAPAYLALATRLRGEAIPVEVYPVPDKLAKQVKYADGARIPAVIFLGDEEKAKGVVKVKLLATREEKTMPVEDLVGLLSS